QMMAIEFIAGPPCPVPTNVTTTAVYSTSANFSWTSPLGSTGTEYVVTTSATPPAPPTGLTTTTASTGSASGLTPATTYYLHVRNKCDSPGKSQWVTISFTTLPPCVVPQGLVVNFPDTNTAMITWQPAVIGLDYKIIVKTNNTVPPNTAGAITSATTSITYSPLQPGTVYYVFVMARCPGGDSSIWMIDSFYVPIPCR